MEKTIHLLIMYTMLVLMMILFKRGQKHHRSRILAYYALVEVITNGFNSLNPMLGQDWYMQFPFLHYLYLPLYCLWVPFFYFYFRSCLSNDFRITRKHWPHFIPFAFFSLYFLFVWLSKGNDYIFDNLYVNGTYLRNTRFAIDIMVRIQYLFYNFLMIRGLVLAERSRKHADSEVVQFGVDVRWLRFVVYGYAIACFSGIVYLVSYFSGYQQAWVINLISITYFFLFFFVIFYNTIMHDPTAAESRQKQSQTPSLPMISLMKRIEELIVGQKLFLEPDLTLLQIAESLNEKERNISQAINTIEKRNVNDYINNFRIEHACTLLLGDKDKPVFEVMYESGFSTKGAFNLAFKRVTGKTPTQYRNEAK